MSENQKAKAIPGGINVLRMQLEGFIHPVTKQVVFSRRGLARNLGINRNSLARILDSESFKALCGKDSPWPKLMTEVSSQPISVIDQSQLAVLIKFLAHIDDSQGFPKYPIPRSMQDAGFPIVLQQSVDEALNIQRDRREYLQAGATVREKLEYKYSYHRMVKATLNGGYGVRSLCRINRQVSGLAVSDADERRAKSSHWRRKCSGIETTKITLGNTIHQKAVEASHSKVTLERNLEIAANRTQQIYNIIDTPF